RLASSEAPGTNDIFDEHEAGSVMVEGLVARNAAYAAGVTSVESMQYRVMPPGTGTLTMPPGHAWQGGAQCELMQSASPLQFAPDAHLVVQVPPQSMSLSLPFRILSLQLTISQR